MSTIGETVFFGNVSEVTDYFEKMGAPKEKDANPAEHMINVVSQDKDWAKIWRDSDEHTQLVADLDAIREQASREKHSDQADETDNYKYASSTGYQMKVVLRRANLQLLRQVDYVTSKIALHLIASCINGFSFFLIGSRFVDLQARVFSVFIFVFVSDAVSTFEIC